MMGVKFVVCLSFLCVAKASVMINVFKDEEGRSLQCSHLECYNKCLKIGYNMGWCGDDGQCVCRNLSHKDSTVLHSIEGSCNNGACDKLCRRLGFTEGVCVGDKCNCDYFAPLAVKRYTMEDSCNNGACDQLCRRLGFTGGVCVGDKCKCDIFAPLRDNLGSLESSTCSDSSCDYLCKRKGYLYGRCVGNRCECGIFLKGLADDQTEDSNTEEKLEQLLEYQDSTVLHSIEGSCNNGACDKLCRRLGFTEGVCVGDICNCDYFAPLAVKRYTMEDSCNNGACDQLCRRLGFTGGVCVGDKCKCDNFAPLAVKRYTMEDSCNNGACDQLCRRLGFTGGVCVGDKCKCDIFAPLRDNLGSLESSTCSDSSCDYLCKRKGYLYGRCVGNRCECGIFLKGLADDQTEDSNTEEKLEQLLEYQDD